jgi:type III secretory pathway component EscT
MIEQFGLSHPILTLLLLAAVSFSLSFREARRASPFAITNLIIGVIALLLLLLVVIESFFHQGSLYP